PGRASGRRPPDPRGPGPTRRPRTEDRRMMSHREALEVGIENILAHKLRSVLTTLGVVFGVAAVISMLSIGEGARRTAIPPINLLGTNNIRVRQVQLTSAQPAQAEKGSADALTYG